MKYGATTHGTRLHTVATVRGRYHLRVAMCGRTLPRHLPWREIMERDDCQQCRRIIKKAYDLVNPGRAPGDKIIHIPAHKIRGIAKRGYVSPRQRQAMRRLQTEEEHREQLWRGRMRREV